MATSKSGVFYDSQANKVVETRPAEGIQIVPPGDDPADFADDIERWKNVAAGVETEPATVTTKTAKRA